jgi:hypothetical protein
MSIYGAIIKKPCIRNKPYTYEQTPGFTDLFDQNKRHYKIPHHQFISDDLAGVYKVTEEAS